MMLKRRMQVSFFSACVFLIFFINSSSHAEIDKLSYIAYLKKIAVEKALFNKRYWHILLHYKKKFSGYESFIDDPKFFLSPEGKYNPEKELLSTIDSFFEESNANANSHPRCRFIARYDWLKEELNINESLLPQVKCDEFEDIYSKVKPKTASLIFPASYPNSPASMFGHTLIRLEGEYHSPLLAYAVNYSAIPEDDFALIYTFKGIFGYYKGIFTALPYYDKVREYSDIERRDIWEYNLNLNEQEVRKMFLHLWELKDIYQYYYFFDENCSYNILFLLESARPSIKLVEKFDFWVIPVDTIRAVIDEGLVEKVVYRPSIYSRIVFLSSFLERDDLKIVEDTVIGKITPDEVLKNQNLTVFKKQKILELAAELLQYKYYKKEITKEYYQKQYYKVLVARSTLPMNTEEVSINAPKSPEKGHESIRLSFGTGIFNDKGYLHFSIRPAYHDLYNSDSGYIEGSQIVFTDLSLRYFLVDKSFILQSFRLIDIVSLTSFDYFNMPFSWRVKTGFERKQLTSKKNDIFYNLTSGGGLSYKSSIGHLFFLLNGAFELGGAYKKDYTTGLGFEIGLMKNIKDFSKVFASMEAMSYVIGYKYKIFKGSLGQSFYINKDVEIRLTFLREKVFDNYFSNIELTLNYFIR
jgi:hypothetical protein